MKLLSVLLAASVHLLLTITNVDAQSLSQTVAYIVTGGAVDLGQMKELNDHAVAVPSFVIGMTMMPQQTIQISDNNRCEAVATIAQGSGSITYYLGSVLPEETRTQPFLNNALFQLSNVYLVAEEKAVCLANSNIGRNTVCQKELDITANTKDIPRVLEAIKYLYAKFCPSAKRKSAF